MGIKQRECFCPWMIASFGFQPVAQAARECKEFADLFSKTRGANRHVTMRRILVDLLPGHPQVRARRFPTPEFPHYSSWVEEKGNLLSNDGLRKAISAARSDAARSEFERVLEWSERVNWAVEQIVRGIPPFPYVRETLDRLRDRADAAVVSATPVEALQREWTEHRVASYAALICGQEMGTKSQHIAATARSYRRDHVIMVGDAPGDLAAARENGVLFYPIVPGEEEESWERLYREALDRFLNGTYSPSYEQELLARFDRALPERPPWEVKH
jgi:phosphoglycolate phosphatase-like HAD superfamily hydrolase